MTDDRDEAGELFDELRSAVEPTVDVDAALGDLHGRAGRPPRRTGRAVGLFAAAAAVVALVVGAVALWPSGESERIDVAGGDDEPVATTGLPCAVGTAIVYLRPGVELASVDDVMNTLEDVAPGDPIEFMDQARTFEEFQRLFDDQPQFVESISPEELPMSFRLVLTEPWTDAQISAVEALPEVLRVEFSEDYSDVVCGGPSTSTTVEETPSPDLGATTTTMPASDTPDTIAELMDRPADVASTDFSIDQSGGTVTADGVTYPLADRAQFVTCGLDGSINISSVRDVPISSMIGEVDGPTDLRLWLYPLPVNGTPGAGDVVQLSFGADCL